MNPLALIIIIAIIGGALFVFAPASITDAIASFPLFKAVVQQNQQGKQASVEEPRANIFRSIESGKIWFPQVAVDASKNIPEATILTLMFDKADANIIYAGTEGNGLYKSVNNGQNWEKLYDRNRVLADNATIYRVAQDPQNVNNLYIAAFQNKYGVFLKSTDGGISFNQTYISQLENYPLRALALHSALSNIIYIGTAQGGFFISEDRGETWKVLKWLTGHITDIVVNPRDPFEIYAVTSDRGLFRSRDGGRTWEDFGSKLSRIAAYNNVMMFTLDPNNQSALYLALANGLVVSNNKGAAWKFSDLLIPPKALPVDAITIDPTNSKRVFVGVGSLLYISEDGGVNWSVQKFNTQKRISTILIDRKDPRNMFLGMKNVKKQ